MSINFNLIITYNVIYGQPLICNQFSVSVPVCVCVSNMVIVSVPLKVGTCVTLQYIVLQTAYQVFTILIVPGRALARVRKNIKVGHTIRYWTAQAAVPFTLEAGGASVFKFCVCLYVGLFACLSGFQFQL